MSGAEGLFTESLMLKNTGDPNRSNTLKIFGDMPQRTMSPPLSLMGWMLDRMTSMPEEPM